MASNAREEQSPQISTGIALACTGSSHPSIQKPCNISPESRVRQDFTSIRAAQDIIPSNAKAIKTLPARSDFPSSISIEVLQPLTEEKIKNVIVMLHDSPGTERSLETLSRRLQRDYPESAFLLVRGQEGVPSGDSGYHWADPSDDRDRILANNSRLLLLDIVKHCLIEKFGFNKRDIILFGHGQGGMAALVAAACWDTVEYAGVISIGGPMPDCTHLFQGNKAKTPVLVLGGPQGNINPAALERMQKTFSHVTQDLRLRSQDAVPEAPKDMECLIEPLLDFLSHRLRRDEWTKQAVLSLDGGGIRGYGSLLILRDLMNKIGDEEKMIDREDGPAQSSFSPFPYKPISKGPESTGSHHSGKGSEDSDTVSYNASPTDDLPNSSLYLPCHYFTYTAGTSTGGLISIMLSRLRMTVEECISEYQSLGEQVFGHPRPLNIGGFPWHKFDYRVLESVIQDVTARYGDKTEFDDEVPFSSSEDFCRTIVLAYASHLKGEIPHLFRTYGTHPAAPDSKKSTLRQRAPRQQGPAPRLPIWKVARATSAAPGYFPPIKIPQGQGPNEFVMFKDGAFGVNNPSEEAWVDIIHKHGELDNSIAIFVSIGTGVHNTSIFADRPGKWQNLRANLKGAIRHPARTRGVHENMAIHSSSAPGFEYFRFDGGERLGEVALDEWKSHMFAELRGKDPMPGYVTIDKMDQATAWYLQKRSVQRDLLELAKLLVHRRRLRTRDKSEWDRFASASWYGCTYKGCERRPIHTADLYKEHIKEKHGIVLADEVIERHMQKYRHCWLYRSPHAQSETLAKVKGKGKAKNNGKHSPSVATGAATSTSNG